MEGGKKETHEDSRGNDGIFRYYSLFFGVDFGEKNDKKELLLPFNKHVVIQ